MKQYLFDFKTYYNKVLLLEYSNKVIEMLKAKFKAENEALTDDNIMYYINQFEKFKNSPKIQNKDITTYSFAELEKLIDTNFTKEKQSSLNIENTGSSDDLIYNENGLEIYNGDTREKCIKYGNGQSWCISRSDSSNMFNTYRYRYDEINFYFIFDAEKSESDPFSKIVLLIDKNGKYYLANKSNSGDFAGSKEYPWSDILKYQPKLKELKHLFKPLPLTEEERRIYNLIKNKTDDDLFKKYGSYDMVEKYISFGHVLTDDQFNSIDVELKRKYINLGNGLNINQYKQCPSGLQKRYLTLHNISIESIIEFSKNDCGIYELEY